MDDSIAQAVVSERRDRAGTTGFEQGGFTTVMDLLSVDGINKGVLKSLYNHVTVRSDVFKVNSFGVLGLGSTPERPVSHHVGVSAIIDRTGYTARILYWQEHE